MERHRSRGHLPGGFRRATTTLVIIALTGCTGVDETLDPSPAQLVDASQVDSFEALSSFGVVPHRGIVRAVNRFQAGVYSEPTAEFTVDGSPVEIAFDGFGYGAVTVYTPGRARVSDGTQTALLDSVASEWPGLAMHRAWPTPLSAEPTHAGAVTTGGVAVDGSSLWWVGAGGPSHRVLEADGDILGMSTLHVDVDGVLDVVAWTAGTVFLLRGRSSGGFGWGGAFTAATLSVAGVDVGDVSGDNLPDVVVAWVAGDGGGTVDIWEGDGLFGFVAAEPRSLGERPVSVDIADNTDEELQQITVLQDDGNWSRFIRGAELQYIPIGPTTPASVVITRDAKLYPSGDLDNDDADEILIAGAREEGQGRAVWIFDVKTDVADCAAGVIDAQCTTEYLPLADETGAYLTMADGNGDDVHDLWLLHEDREMFALAYDPAVGAAQQYQKLVVFEAPAHGPFGLEDVDFDGDNDLFIAGGPVWWQWFGEAFQDLETFWQPRRFDYGSVRQPMNGPFVFVDDDDDPQTIELVGFTIEGARTRLKVIRKNPEGGSVGLADIEIAGGAVPDDLALCGDDLWVVVQGEVMRVDLALDDAVGTPTIAGRTGTSVRRVTCGTGPGGAAAAALEGPDILLLDRGVDRFDSVPAGGANDLAFGDFGAGPELGTCTTAGCTIEFWAYGEDGTAVFAKGDADGITVVDETGATESIGGFGVLSIGDLDLDGHPDLLGLDGKLVSLHRSTGESIAPLELFHGTVEMTGPLAVGDGNGDGQPDLWAIDSDDLLFHTLPPNASAATGSGDTGLP